MKFRPVKSKQAKTMRPRVVFACMLFTFAFSSTSWAHVRLVFLDSAIVNDTVITLGDIAAISGVPQGVSAEELSRTPIGEAAPAGYSRFVNIDDVVRHSLRSLKDVDIDKKNSAKRISIKTDFQEVCLEAYEKDFFDYIRSTAAWPEGDYQLKIINRNEKWKCMKRPFSITFEGLSSKYPKGNFVCKLFMRQGSKKIKVPISCFISITTQVVVASAPMKRGTPLSAQNCKLGKMDITHFNYLPYVTLNDIESRSISRSVDQETIIHEKNTIPIPLIIRDQQVQLMINRGKIRVSINARAVESGGIGNNILVENEMTHKLIKAKIVKNGQVVLLQGDGNI